VTAAEVRLKLIDATEFAEMLTFISDWLTGADHDQLANSFAHFWAPDSSGLSEDAPTCPIPQARRPQGFRGERPHGDDCHQDSTGAVANEVVNERATTTATAIPGRFCQVDGAGCGVSWHSRPGADELARASPRLAHNVRSTGSILLAGTVNDRRSGRRRCAGSRR
jgi:hypothetical protein